MKQIIINHEKLQTRIALVEDGTIQEYYTETSEKKRIVGSVFNGKITNLEPSLQAAFVDIGLQKNAFLHYWDMIPATKEMLEKEQSPDSGNDDIEIPDTTDVEAPENGSLGKSLISLLSNPKGLFKETKKDDKPPPRPRSRRPRGGKKQEKTVDVSDIPKRFKVKSDVIVQVTKGPIGTKGPRVTTNLSIPGRYVVLLPNSTHLGISKKIEDRAERQRLKTIVRNLNLPSRMGLICRTAVMGLSEKAIAIDVRFLLEKWIAAEQTMEKKKSPVCIYQEPNLLEQTIRDSLTHDIDEIVVDSKKAYELIRYNIRKLDKKDQTRIKLYNSPKPIFQSYNIHNQIQAIYGRLIPLPSGGELCIDETEALIAIDINSKKSRGGKDHPETILNTNLEAAEEIGRQFRLRNVGGLVIIDFIDMRSRKDRTDVQEKMREVLSRDRAKTKILPISKLGLMEMTRQREYESLQDATFVNCNYCNGKGLVKSSITISIELQRRLQELLRRDRGTTPIRVLVHPTVLARLKEDDASVLESMEKEFGGDLTFRADPDIHHEEFELINMRSGKKI